MPQPHDEQSDGEERGANESTDPLDAIDPRIDDSVRAEALAASEAIHAVEGVRPAARREAADPGWLRIVIVVWCFWLLGAWAAAWFSDTSVPRVRWMMFAGSFGLMLVWPAFRLSQQVRPEEQGRGGLLVLLDWMALIGVYQAVIWSLHLLAGWPLIRGIWLDAAVIAWSLLTALIVAAARQWPTGLARAAGMSLCIALVFAEPIVLWLVVISGGEGWPMRVSPIHAFWELTQPPSRGTISPWDRQTLMIAWVAVTGWLAMGLWWIVAGAVLRRQRERA